LRIERCDVWGSELSPFTLKVLALCRHAGVGARLLPTGGEQATNLRALATVNLVRRRWRRPSFPKLTELDELPLVPYLIGPSREVVVDSSAIATWLDDRAESTAPRSVPVDGAVRFAARLIDEYFDEMGLYFAHHNRWVVSAATNDAGERLAREFRSLVPRALRQRFADGFAARQVRRLPYLFSVAPADPERYDVAPARRPVGRVGFPPTHELLDTCFRRILDRLETVLRAQPFFFGEAFTVADASAYGQLGINLDDESAAASMGLRAPTVVAWARRIRAGAIPSSAEPPRLTPALVPLLEEIASTFFPLMRQNEAAFEAARSRSARRFNESAFDRGECLFDGVLLERPFRAVVKTFQVRVWRDLQRDWEALQPSEKARLPLTLG
jgi:glutathione S-transferase